MTLLKYFTINLNKFAHEKDVGHCMLLSELIQNVRDTDQNSRYECC